MTDNLIVRTDTRGVCSIALNRHDSHNAFDEDVIEDLTIQLTFAADDDFVRAIIITGEGPTFSSGADIRWLKSMVRHDHATNSMKALKMAQMLQKLYALPKPTIAKINGPALGGALGLIACCDIAIAINTSYFGFPEVKLGIIPAIVSPYIVSAIGHRNAKRLFMTGATFGSDDALSMGLIHKVVHHSLLDETIEEELELLLKAGPSAQMECKRLLQKLAGISDDISEYTAELVAQIRISKEGQEGLAAFLEKRDPDWIKDSN
ncbi:enoyl-CoA hydratase-related protein [Kaarinaea lacus]